MARAREKSSKQSTRQRTQRGSSQRLRRPAIPLRVTAPPPLLPPTPQVEPPAPLRPATDVVPTRDDKYRDVIPKMSEEAYQALKDSIRQFGMLEAIVLDQEGAIADGHNRWDAYLELQTEGVNVELKIRTEHFADEAAAKTFIRQVNIARRQLTSKQRRKVIADEIKADTKSSSRAIAARLGVDHKTVESVRQELEGRGEFPHVETRTDTKGRKQPAKRRRRSRRQEPAQDAEADIPAHDPEIEPTGPETPSRSRPTAEADKPEPDPDAAAVEPEQPEPISGNGINGAELPQTDPEAAKDEATRVFLRAVWAEASERGLQPGKVGLINTGRQWLIARIGQDDAEFFAWLRGEDKAEDFEAAADRLN